MVPHPSFTKEPYPTTICTIIKVLILGSESQSFITPFPAPEHAFTTNAASVIAVSVNSIYKYDKVAHTILYSGWSSRKFVTDRRGQRLPTPPLMPPSLFCPRVPKVQLRKKKATCTDFWRGQTKGALENPGSPPVLMELKVVGTICLWKVLAWPRGQQGFTSSVPCWILGGAHGKFITGRWGQRLPAPILLPPSLFPPPQDSSKSKKSNAHLFLAEVGGLLRRGAREECGESGRDHFI